MKVLTKYNNLEEFLRSLNAGDFFEYADPFSFSEIMQCGRRLGLKIQACVTPQNRCVVSAKDDAVTYITLDAVEKFG